MPRIIIKNNGQMSSMTIKKPGFRRRSRVLLVIVGIIFLLSLILCQPWGIHNLVSKAKPVHNYQEAIQRIEKIQNEEENSALMLNPVGRLIFMTHGRKMEQSIIFVHGYTNCPQQFKALGERFFDLGYNVLIARMPHHGLADRLTNEHAKLSTEEMIAYGDDVVDIAQGLGEKVTIVGLSAGANIVAWEAQYRQDLDLAVIIAPVFGYQGIPIQITPALANICMVIPNMFRWWEPELKEKGGTAYSYPRFSTRATAHILRLGYAVLDKAKQKAPSAKRVLIVTNEGDRSVHPVPIKQLADRWLAHGGNVKSYEFDGKLKLEHDLIDPAQPYAKPEVSYPILIDIITKVDSV